MNTSKKIKIARIIARLNIGGPAIHTILLTSELTNPDFESHLICGNPGSDEGDMGYYARQKNVVPYVIPELVREIDFVRDAKAFIKIIRFLRCVKPDIVHTHTAKAGFLGRVAVLWYWLTTGRRLCCLHTFHGHVFDGYFSKAKTKLFITIEKCLALHTNAILTVSQSVKDELLELKIAPANKIAVLPLGFELQPFLAIPAPERTLPVRIGIIGRLVPIKNHRMFLVAAKRLIALLPGTPIEFTVAGDGQLRSELENNVNALGLQTFVHFTGWQEDLAPCYADLNIVALTSLNEGTPVSLIEAMAAGRTVIATKVGGVGDLMGPLTQSMREDTASFDICQRGVTVASGDPESLAAGLRYLIDNPKARERLAHYAREYAASTFSKEHLVKNITALYKNLLSKA